MGALCGFPACWSGGGRWCAYAGAKGELLKRMAPPGKCGALCGAPSRRACGRAGLWACVLRRIPLRWGLNLGLCVLLAQQPGCRRRPEARSAAYKLPRSRGGGAARRTADCLSPATSYLAVHLRHLICITGQWHPQSKPSKGCDCCLQHGAWHSACRGAPAGRKGAHFISNTKRQLASTRASVVR